MNSSVILTIFLLGCVATYVTATRCYVCKSEEDSSCLDKYTPSSSHEYDCSLTSNEEGCSKTSSTGKFLSMKFHTVERKCDTQYNNGICEKPFKFDLEIAGLTDVKAKECSCDGDLCNQAPATTCSFISLIALTLTTYFLAQTLIRH